MAEWHVAIDVETANHNRHSICQIGLVAFEGESELWRWTTYVNPEEDFGAINVRVHGIRSLDIADAPTLPSVLATIVPSLEGQFVVSHTSFDREAVCSAACKYGFNLPPVHWLDSCEIARKVWPELENHKLPTLAKHLGLPLDHHHAVNDAAASGQILARAIALTGNSLSEWKALSHKEPFDPQVSAFSSDNSRRFSERVEMQGRKDGPLAGHVVVFTGEFSVSDLRMAQIASELGCDVDARFRKKRTTMLVVGKRDPALFAGKAKSNKQLSAESAVAEGYRIAIMDEQGFHDLASEYVPA